MERFYSTNLAISRNKHPTQSETCKGQDGPVVLVSCPAAHQDQGSQQDKQGQEKQLSPVHVSGPNPTAHYYRTQQEYLVIDWVS